MTNEGVLELASVLISVLRLREARTVALCEMSRKQINYEGQLLGGNIKISWDFDGRAIPKIDEKKRNRR